MRDRPVQEVAKDILSYFLRNPQATDDLEGVARWRLLNETVHRGVEETSQALDWLVQHGFLGRVSRPGTGTLFSLGPEHRVSAEAFLSDSGEQEAGNPKSGS